MVVAALGVLFLSSPATGQAGSPTAVFRIGDAVRVAVWDSDSPDLSGTFDIAEDGTVIHPLYRQIQIAGMALPQAEMEFRRVLRRFQENPEFVVEPLFRVPIAGEVAAPNVYSLPAYLTVMEALAQAGGPTATADIRRARLQRDGAEIVADLTAADNPFESLRVRSGDRIILHARGGLWRQTIEPALRTAGSLASLAYLFLRISDRL
jgi:protein involved in polysaccharide export with SLBB domain